MVVVDVLALSIGVCLALSPLLLLAWLIRSKQRRCTAQASADEEDEDKDEADEEEDGEEDEEVQKTPEEKKHDGQHSPRSLQQL